MSRLLWLADVLRAAGLPVVEEAGWQTRSAAEDSDASGFSPRGVIIHETRGSATSSDAGEIGVLINGRVGLSGPIAQLYLSRAGVWHVVAAGLCHHVKTGWGGPFAGLGNTHLLGIEPAHGEAEDWASKPAQYASYVAGVAAILRHTGWPPPVGHKEHQPGDKPDPEFSMPAFRSAVAAYQEGDMFTEADYKAFPWQYNGRGIGDNNGTTVTRSTLSYMDEMLKLVRKIAEQVDIDPAELEAIEAAAREGAAEAMSPEAIAAAIPDDIASQIVTLLGQRIAAQGA